MVSALLALMAGAVFISSNASNWRRRQRIVGTPTTPIAQAPGDGVVEIRGRVAATEQGTFAAPISGRQVVYCRIRVEETEGRTKTTRVDHADSRDLFVEDGSGERARIVTRTASVILQKRSMTSSGTFEDPPQHLIDILQTHGIESETWLGQNKTLTFYEEALEPGDALFAIGPSHREAGPPAQEGYRTEPTRKLVMSGMGDGDLELLVSDKTEQDLTRHLGSGLAIGFGLVGVSLVAIASVLVRLALS